jgi:uracil-DNA glycosylase
MDLEKIGFLHSVQSLLRYHQVIGIEHYPSDDSTSSFLQTVDLTSLPAPNVTSKSQSLPNAAIRIADNREIETCESIAGEVRGCTNCFLHTKRWATTAGCGGDGNKAKLLIVGGWLSGEKEAHLPKDSIFGLEEDRMVARMLAAMNLASGDAFITNVIKCAIPKDCEPSMENVHSCFPYLRRQIQVLHPIIICAMGIDAAKALLKSTQPLSKIRGRMHTYTESDKMAIPVIPTYHPTFLLKNQKFKRATWEDLQIIGKYLQSQK